MNETTNGINNVLAILELEKELGKYYEEIIELEWDMTTSQFIEYFWSEEEMCFEI